MTSKVSFQFSSRGQMTGICPQTVDLSTTKKEIACPAVMEERRTLPRSGGPGVRHSLFRSSCVSCLLYWTPTRNSTLTRPYLSVSRPSTTPTRIRWMRQHDKWRCQYDESVTEVTSEESIQTRCVSVDSKTRETPISYQVARVFYYEQQIKRELKKIHISGCRCNERLKAKTDGSRVVGVCLKNTQIDLLEKTFLVGLFPVE